MRTFGQLVAVMTLALGCGRSGLDSGLLPTTAETSGGADGTGLGPAGAGGATPHRLAPIPCGNGRCESGAQICCVQRQRHRTTETCISATASCDSGASVGCVDATSCSDGEVCCESLLDPATMCAAPQSCVNQPGVILCRDDADCPGFASHCCATEGGDVCAARACPSGPDQGPGGNGEGGPQD
jgi:hypothetical protein